MISTYFNAAIEKADDEDRIHPAFKLHGTDITAPLFIIRSTLSFPQ